MSVVMATTEATVESDATKSARLFGSVNIFILNLATAIAT